MKLLSLQRRMARAVMMPLTRSEGMRRLAVNGRPMRKVAAEFIKPNDRLTSFERLEIYNRQYWFRVLSSFGEDFPGLRAVLGDRRFDALAKAALVGGLTYLFVYSAPQWMQSRRPALRRSTQPALSSSS